MRIILAFLFILTFTVLYCPVNAQNQPNNTALSFSLADRDRIVKLETNLEILNQRIISLEKRMDERFDGQNDKFDAQNDKIDNIFTLMVILLAAMFTLMGFVLWDRRTAITPVQREQKRMIEALRLYSKDDEKLAEILRKTGIL